MKKRKKKLKHRTAQQKKEAKLSSHHHNLLIENTPPQNMSQKKNRSIIVYLLIIIGIFILLNLIMLSLQIANPIEKEQVSAVEKDKGIENEVSYTSPSFLTIENETTVEMKLPAVDVNKSGVVTTLKVTAKPGAGRTLVDIEGLLFWADTQQSIRVARQVAANITKVDVNKVDLIYSIKAQASLIGGPSAGSALTIATIAALRGEKPLEAVMMTGTINHDGTIGPVSEILEKAKAAKNAGASIFLVPLLQGKEVIYETTQHCETYGNTEFCTEETRPKRIDVSQEAGIKIIEVSSIPEAMEHYFT